MAPRFFDTPDRQDREIPYSQPRAIVGSVERLNLSRNQAERVDKREVQAWMMQAWRVYETNSAVMQAFNMVAQLVSRARLYPAIVTDPERSPNDLASWLEDVKERGSGSAENAEIVVEKAYALVKQLTENTPGRESGMLRTMALNLSVTGEIILAHDEKAKEWLVLSSEEITTQGDKFRIVRSRTGTSGGGANTKRQRFLDNRAFVARIWRPHPRWGDEAISSMLGALDDAEQLALLDEVMRVMARRALNAGVLFIPSGLSAYGASDAEESLADSIAKAALAVTEREAAIETVTPKVVQGPPELGDAIKRIVLSDAIDDKISNAADRLQERILQGLDVPSDWVAGLADSKYASAVAVTDDAFRTYLLPLCLMIVDSLTQVFLRPILRKGLTPEQQKIADDIVLWCDTSQITSRPDSSQAASELYDKKAISAETLRRVKGFDETDAPDEKELLQRMVLDRAPISADQAAALIEQLDPEFFKRQRGANQEAAGFPDDISSLLSGDEDTGTPEEGSAAAEAQGGEINPNGRMPPREVPVPQP